VQELLASLSDPVLGASLPDLKLPTHIRFDNVSSADYTVVEVETEDRLGLLHTLVRVLTELKLDTSVAKISTDCGVAIDTFYLTDALRHKLLPRDQQRAVERRLREELKKLG
jgi:[protein-PII] uridylyltransferase